VLRRLTILFQASADFRVKATNRYQEMESWDLLGFVPFQRHHRLSETGKISDLPLPVSRFLQPFDRYSIAQNNLRIYSTPLALLGSRPTEPYSITITSNHLVGLLLRRYFLFMVSFSNRTVIHTPAPQQLNWYLGCLSDFEPLITLQQLATILRLSRP